MLKTEKEIISWLNKQKISNYIINNNLTVTVNNDVNLNKISFENGLIPVKFSFVNGFFSVRGSNLKSLEGTPDFVKGDFDCSDCDSLTSLKGSPETVENYYICTDCKNLISFEGTQKIGKVFISTGCNNINSLDYYPVSKDRNFRLFSDYLHLSWEQIINTINIIDLDSEFTCDILRNLFVIYVKAINRVIQIEDLEYLYGDFNNSLNCTYSNYRNYLITKIENFKKLILIYIEENQLI